MSKKFSWNIHIPVAIDLSLIGADVAVFGNERCLPGFAVLEIGWTLSKLVSSLCASVGLLGRNNLGDSF